MWVGTEEFVENSGEFGLGLIHFNINSQWQGRFLIRDEWRMETDFKSDEDVRVGLDEGFVTSIDFFVERKYLWMVEFLE